ncbi:MAG: hypothetical protein ACW990_05565 [Promethearchaeota archaeon]
MVRYLWIKAFNIPLEGISNEDRAKYADEAIEIYQERCAEGSM